MTSPHIDLYISLKEKIEFDEAGFMRRKMSERRAPPRDHDGHGLYEIRVEGHLDDRWVAWFDDFSLRWEPDGNTVLTGPVVDQAALHGLLRKVRDLGMPLVSVARVGPV